MGNETKYNYYHLLHCPLDNWVNINPTSSGLFLFFSGCHRLSETAGSFKFVLLRCFEL